MLYILFQCNGFAFITDSEMISGPHMVEEINKITSFECTIYSDDPAFRVIYPKITYVTIMDTYEMEIIFRGRVQSSETSSTDGSKHVVCEEARAFLKDGMMYGTNWGLGNMQYSISSGSTPVIPYYGVSSIFGGGPSIFNEAIKNDPKRSFYPSISVYDINRINSINVSVPQDWEGKSFYDIIDEVCNDAGIEWRVVYTGYESNGNQWPYTIEIAPRFGFMGREPITGGFNLKELKQTLDASEVYNRFVFVGGTDLNGMQFRLGPTGGDWSESRISTLSNLYKNAPWTYTINAQGERPVSYIDIPELVEKMGGIYETTVTFDDITPTSTDDYPNFRNMLYAKAVEYIKNVTTKTTKFSISAYDLYYVAGLNAEKLILGNYYVVTDTVTDICVIARLTKKDTNFSNPEESSLEFTTDDSDSENIKLNNS